MLHAGKKERKKVIKAKSWGEETTVQKETKEAKSQQTKGDVLHATGSGHKEFAAKGGCGS